jgi:N-acetylmuramoyl-L-alanine amidase
MKSTIYAAALFLLCLMCGCASRQVCDPEAAAFAKKASRPICAADPQEIAMANMPRGNKAYNQGIIVLDPGHGGEDFGTHSNGEPVFHEKHLNLSTTQIVRSYLQQFGYKVVMTRNDDTFIPLDQRALFANRQAPKLFVSIHYNSAPSEEAEGIEVFYYKDDDDKQRVATSKALAQCVLDKTIQNTKAKSRGVKHGNYAVIRETDMPAVLIEGGFLTNKSEAQKIVNSAYMKSLALGIAQGIRDYLTKEPLLADKR